MPLGFFFKTLSYLFIDFYYKITIIRFRGKEANDNELPIKIFALKAGGMIHVFKSIKWVIYMYICTLGTLSWMELNILCKMTFDINIKIIYYIIILSC